MNWKPVVGCLLIVLLGLRLPSLLHNVSASAYGMGYLVGFVCVALLGVWLIRSGRSHAHKR